MCMVCGLYVYMYTMYIPGAHRSQDSRCQLPWNCSYGLL